MDNHIRATAEEVALVGQRNFIEDLLSQEGEVLPSFDEMRLQNQEERTRPQTSASVDAQIKHFQDRHAKDLKRAHEYEAALYWQNAVDLWQSTQELPANHASRAYDAAVQVVERFGSENRDAWRSSPSAPLYLLETRHAHHRMLLPLSAKRKDLLKKEEQGQRRLESMFPQSVEEWRMMKHDDLQRRVARYLASDGKRQEVLRDEYKWAWRQTDSLIREYGSNETFKAEIQAKIKEDFAVKDPRKRPAMKLVD